VVRRAENEFEWTFVAGDMHLMDALRAEERLEVAATTCDAAGSPMGHGSS